MTMTEATQAINALRESFKNGGVYIDDSKVLRLVQLNFTPESNEVKMLLTRSTSVDDLFAEVEKLPQVETNFNRYTHEKHQQEKELASRKFNERKYG